MWAALAYNALCNCATSSNGVLHACLTVIKLMCVHFRQPATVQPRQPLYQPGCVFLIEGKTENTNKQLKHSDEHTMQLLQTWERPFTMCGTAVAEASAKAFKQHKPLDAARCQS